MLELLFIVPGVAVYIAIAIEFSRLQAYLLNVDRDHVDVVISSVAWPLSAIVWLILVSVRGISFLLGSSRAFLLKSRKKKVNKDHELFPGVERPSIILVKMICNKMLKNFDKVLYDRWADDGIRVSWGLYSKGASLRSFSAEVNGQEIHIPYNDKEVKKLLLNTINQCKNLKKEKEQADRLAANEHNAVTAIEFLTVGQKKQSD